MRCTFIFRPFPALAPKLYAERGMVSIVLIQSLAVTTLTLFEFIPAFYPRSRVRPELLGCAQSMLTFISFGAGSVIGGMLGGLAAEKQASHRCLRSTARRFRSARRRCIAPRAG